MGISWKSLREIRQVSNHHSGQGHFPCRTPFDTFNDDCYHFTVDHLGPPTRIRFGNVAAVQQRSSSETGTKMWTSEVEAESKDEAENEIEAEKGVEAENEVEADNQVQAENEFETENEVEGENEVEAENDVEAENKVEAGN